MQALIEFYKKDWYFAGPMTVMTFVAFSLVIWRWLLNRSANSNLDLILPDLQTNLKQKGIKAAINLCKEERGFIPSMLYVAGLEAAEQGVAAMRRSMTAAMEFEIIPRLNFLMAPILAIAKVSTMVGLLGTVVSMINTFTAITAQSNNPQGIVSHSQAIGLALFATAFGLLTAIPLVFSHVMFKAWIANYELKMKAAAQKLVILVMNTNKD